MQIPIFVINLDRSTCRMQEIAGRLALQGLSYERFPAFDGLEIKEEFIAERYPQFMGVFKSGHDAGGLGCYISHVEVSRLILERGLGAACVIEDDAEFDDDFYRFVDAGTSFPHWAEAIKLEAWMKRKFVPCCHIDWMLGRRLAYVPGNNANGAACYIMTKAGAEKMINIVAKVEYGPLDRWVFDYGISTIKSLHVLPYPSRQLRKMSVPSTLSKLNTMPKKKVRKTVKQVIRIRAKRSRDVLAAFLESRKVIGPRMLRFALAKVQSKKIELVA